MNEETKKAPYVKPQLICHGDIRTLTLGGSPGAGESGPDGGMYKNE